MSLKSLIAFAALNLASVAALASNYPSDYPIHTTCAEQGPVKVCRSLQGGGGVAVDVYYRGMLGLYGNNDVRMFMKVNYNDGSRQSTFPMQYRGDLYFGRVTNGCLVGEVGGCLVWGTDTMKHLLFYASRSWVLNGLSVEVAFFDNMNRWDSRYGQNYRFYFPEERVF